MLHKIRAIRHDILTAIEEIHEFTEGRTLEELLNERGFQLILEREFEIIGEALFRIRSIEPALFADIPSGSQIIGMRNILAHGYDRVDYQILWDAATKDLEALRRHVAMIPDSP